MLHKYKVAPFSPENGGGSVGKLIKIFAFMELMSLRRMKKKILGSEFQYFGR